MQSGGASSILHIALRGKKMKIGVFIGDICHSYQQTVLKTLKKYAKEKNITVYIFGSFVIAGNNILHAEGEKSIIYLPPLSMFDGIISASDTMNHFGMEQDLIHYLTEKATCPIVSLRAEKDNFHNILADNENAMYEMTKHFIEKGKKEICFVTGRMEMLDAKERLAGYQRAMAEAGLQINSEDIFYGNYWKSKSKEIVETFFEKRKKAPQVIICSNDYMALGVCEELKKRGIRVPEDVAVTGFDNIMEAQIQTTALTSVEVPFDEMTKKAVDTLIALKEGKTVEKNQRLSTINRYRESCGCKEGKSELNKIAYLEQMKNSRLMAKECIYMSTEFEGALNEQECIEWASLYFRDFGAKKCFICLHPTKKEYEADKDMTLRHYLDKDGKSVFVNIPFCKKNLLPEEFLPQIEHATSLFLPVHCKNEIYGYIILQLKEDDAYILDEKFEFLNLTFGNSLKKNYMYYELFAVKDIVQMYLQDPLTELYNRRGYDRRLVELHQMFKGDVCSIAMVSIDMDGLKYINDTYGHAEGDTALKKLSRCLQKALNENEFCARIGGDEFAAALIIDYPDRAEAFREKLNQLIWEENIHIQKDYRLDYSIGICLVKEHQTFMECMHRADERMYKDKKGKVYKQGR